VKATTGEVAAELGTIAVELNKCANALRTLGFRPTPTCVAYHASVIEDVAGLMEACAKVFDELSVAVEQARRVQ
jgi:hypothetical protein